ncbi:Phosphatidate cytidylyltransferase [Methylobacterium adhaesivum]|uniref:Phosphatidate cytidylyltransferase n=1 Tax=Methylobacterium adhaesivum TaxID=333297 RepID=A0ABT8BDX0_9HYPH|nr:phosphatidate cytidylyltransferase [Methylobacterium adhaesivum]MDN3590282.1 phosphatidate cytidylyltransferase [Methylobacterium adhaesivum]GJD30788.1 Phosphatidate cytidylyltransferase [Methylobacterium adhaesivum]
MTGLPNEAASGARRNPFAGREFQLRLVSGVVLAALVVSALVIGGGLFALIWLAAAVVGTAEWIGMSRTGPRRLLVAVIAVTLGGLALCLREGASPLVFVAVAAAGITGLLIVARDGAARGRAVAGLAGGAVVALVPPGLRDDPAIGILGPAWMFAVVWSTDVVAYITGRTFGGPKLMPAVSPKKTWSGALGGLTAGTAAGIGAVIIARDHGGSALAATSLLLVGLVSAAASVFSQAGDLAESALKRHWGVKDSGRSIPGHGGVMDRLDGFAAVALLAGLYLLAHRMGAV